jgi:hypothetical protein
MLPEIWGKHAWNFIHLVTLGYPLNPTDYDKKHYKEYFTALVYILPCDKCKYNLHQNIKKYPLTNTVLSCRKNLVKWGIDLHNVVNYHTNKPILSYTDALESINKLVDPPEKKNDSIYYLVIGIALLIGIYIAYKYVNGSGNV